MSIYVHGYVSIPTVYQYMHIQGSAYIFIDICLCVHIHMYVCVYLHLRPTAGRIYFRMNPTKPVARGKPAYPEWLGAGHVLHYILTGLSSV